jgi:hypothetical protein
MSQDKNQNMFQTCVLDQKVQRKKTHVAFLKILKIE